MYDLRCPCYHGNIRTLLMALIPLNCLFYSLNWRISHKPHFSYLQVHVQHSSVRTFIAGKAGSSCYTVRAVMAIDWSTRYRCWKRALRLTSLGKNTNMKNTFQLVTLLCGVQTKTNPKITHKQLTLNCVACSHQNQQELSPRTCKITGALTRRAQRQQIKPQPKGFLEFALSIPKVPNFTR